jgi:hypothetical protein
VKASLTHPTLATHAMGDIPGTDRLLGRTQAELADAMTWLAWYAPGIYNAVMDYMDYVNGELAPALCSPRPVGEAPHPQSRRGASLSSFRVSPTPFAADPDGPVRRFRHSAGLRPRPIWLGGRL